MKNSEMLKNGLRFVLLILLQVLVLDHINFLGYINPYAYIFFILFFPLSGNKSLLIALAFLQGLIIDVFNDTGGIHAAASVFIAWIRPVVLKFSFGVSYEYNTVNFGKANISQQITYILTMVVAHHLMLFCLEIFSFKHMDLILKSTLFSSIFSLIIIHSLILLFNRNIR